MDTQNLSEKFHVQQDLHIIRCTPKQLTEKARDAVVNDLRSGVLGYVNLKNFWKEFPDLFATLEDARRYVENIPELFITEAFVVSRVRISILEKECTEILQKDGLINLMVCQIFILYPSERTNGIAYRALRESFLRPYEVKLRKILKNLSWTV